MKYYTPAKTLLRKRHQGILQTLTMHAPLMEKARVFMQLDLTDKQQFVS